MAFIKAILMIIGGFFLLTMIGCGMLVSAVSKMPRHHRSASSGDGDTRGQDAWRTGSSRRRSMVDAERDALVRAIAEQAAREDLYGSGDGGHAPHFEPGEPMVDPSQH